MDQIFSAINALEGFEPDQLFIHRSLKPVSTDSDHMVYRISELRDHVTNHPTCPATEMYEKHSLEWAPAARVSRKGLCQEVIRSGAW